ncbi:YdeI/OmpD-associated family protein [Montanilutibacter psychrotolerans]|uniref:Bacteriocin-protection protein n=1 Tax=Montanilutibacter psychrotolerans TaxID=1327343 RepID=A0A3M8SYF3_9GAMM|nr:YdeI/OmpD-associated family protein [Lysobacter psychrotolerans]RNF86448.1 hypothetical protein EER27_03275 [Lysobacter psychrotolerans]
MATELPDNLPIKLFRDASAFETWLCAHVDGKGVWLQIAKKGAGLESVSYVEALDVALCHGWIDGQKRGLDAQYFLQRFTPRRARSLWSQINIGKIERLIAQGRMGEGGLREVEAAKADGRWQAAYASSTTMDVPPELAEALAANPEAAAFFEQLDKTNRYAFCWRVHTAKKPETRLARARKFVEMMASGDSIHPRTKV